MIYVVTKSKFWKISESGFFDPFVFISEQSFVKNICSIVLDVELYKFSEQWDENCGFYKVLNGQKFDARDQIF